MMAFAAVVGLPGTKFVYSAVGLLAVLFMAGVGVFLVGFRMPVVLLLFPLSFALGMVTSPGAASTIALSCLTLVAIASMAQSAVALSRGSHLLLDSLNLWLKVVVSGSLLLFYLRPDIGMESRWPNAGAMIGLYVHKNLMGSVLIAATVILIYARGSTGVKAVWLGIYALDVWNSDSTTAFAVTLGALSLAFFLGRFKWDSERSRALFRIVLLLALAPAVIVVAVLGPSLVDKLGIFSPAADRGRIWQGALAAWREMPWSGWGLGTSFGQEDYAAQIIRNFTGWTVPSGHSGYVSALVEGGLPALLALVVTVAWALAVTWRARSLERWPFVVAVVFCLTNVTDTRTDGLSWFLLAAAIGWSLTNRTELAGRAGEAC